MDVSTATGRFEVPATDDVVSIDGVAVARGEPLKILVADDEPAMVGVIGAILGSAGHRIIAAYDGREAIRRFEEDRPDLVLLDLAMPGMDGADVCRRIRAAGDTPIIVVSGESDLGVTVELLDAGADDISASRSEPPSFSPGPGPSSGASDGPRPATAGWSTAFATN